MDNEELDEEAQAAAGPLQAVIDRGSVCPKCGSDLVLCVPVVGGMDDGEPMVALECRRFHEGDAGLHNHHLGKAPCNWTLDWEEFGDDSIDEVRRADYHLGPNDA